MFFCVVPHTCGNAPSAVLCVNLDVHHAASPPRVGPQLHETNFAATGMLGRHDSVTLDGGVVFDGVSEAVASGELLIAAHGVFSFHALPSSLSAFECRTSFSGYRIRAWSSIALAIPLRLN